MSNSIPAQLQQQIAQAHQGISQQLSHQFNQTAGALRQDQNRRLQQIDQRLSDVARVCESMKIRREHEGIVRIEDIPGRRVPFDYFVDILISNNDMSQRESSITISQEGPFVAVRRFAVFQSVFQYQVSSAGSNVPARYSGRSFGRWRPISSVLDSNDSANHNMVTTANPTTAGAYIANLELPSTQSNFRTMQFDGRIMVVNAGSSFPRQNISVPSALWSDGYGGLPDLGCLDFFERGEVITFQIQPTHVNNPPFGNADGTNIFGSSGWPFSAGQFDQHEGIVTPTAFSVTNSSPTSITRLSTDSITRLPDGVLTLGFVGYRIQQPPGV